MLVTTGSITTATRLALALAREAGITARVIQTPAQIKTGGCTYAVRYDDSADAAVRSIIRKYKLHTRKFYRERLEAAGRVYNAVP